MIVTGEPRVIRYSRHGAVIAALANATGTSTIGGVAGTASGLEEVLLQNVYFGSCSFLYVDFADAPKPPKCARWYDPFRTYAGQLDLPDRIVPRRVSMRPRVMVHPGQRRAQKRRAYLQKIWRE